MGATHALHLHQTRVTTDIDCLRAKRLEAFTLLGAFFLQQITSSGSTAGAAESQEGVANFYRLL